jgi:FkbM family methyltransferase
MKVNNFTVLESEYGRFIVNRHCTFQAESLVKTGRPHIQAELNNILAIIARLPDGCVVVDAGANIGLVSIPIAQAIQTRAGVVHAFEAQRMIFYALCGAAALNDLTNLFIFHRALGAAPGWLGATLPDYGQAQDFGLFSLTDQAREHVEKIPVVTIDSLALERLDFLKIDVEGMEIDVLDGARETLRRFRPICWIEYWKLGAAQLQAPFADLDYEFVIMDALNMLAAPVGRLGEMGIRIIDPGTTAEDSSSVSPPTDPHASPDAPPEI